MKTSKVIFDIQAREGIVARASFHRDNPTEIITSAKQYPSYMPTQCATMMMVNYCLTMLREAAEKDPKVKGRYTFIVPENVAIRFFEAQKCVNNKSDVMASLFKSWMNAPQYNVTVQDEDGNAQTCNVWEAVLYDLVSELEIMMDKSSGWSLNFVNSRTLYRYEIRKADGGDITAVLAAGDTVTFSQGVNVEKGLVCAEQNFLTGTFTVSRRDVRDRNQNVTPHFYVPRLIQAVNEKDGSQVNVTANEIVADENLEPVYQAGVYVVNAAFLRIKTAEMLPRIKSVKTAQVTTVNAESNQF